jgi:aryl-alcohol dehydrogenase-like predicted oxidoreductase
MKLCLGTAQFGLDYGINNSRGKIRLNEITEILNYAHENEILMLDTASAYGNSESALGDAFDKINNEFQLITKYPANIQERPYLWIDTSLRRLGKSKIYGYLFHNYSIFYEHPEYIEDFVRIKQSGKALKIGFSLYYPSEAEYILKNNIPCDIVQVPYNIFDQRFGSLFQELKSKEIAIHVRSIFLQGFFFI